MRPRVLVVEDNDLVARAFALLIEPYADAELAADAATAKRALESGGWTAVILDIRLPDGTGLDVLEHARARGYAGPALVYSGNHDAAQVKRALELDADYLVKPAPSASLTGFIKKAIAQQA